MQKRDHPLTIPKSYVIADRNEDLVEFVKRRGAELADDAGLSDWLSANAKGLLGAIQGAFAYKKVKVGDRVRIPRTKKVARARLEWVNQVVKAANVAYSASGGSTASPPPGAPRFWARRPATVTPAPRGSVRGCRNGRRHALRRQSPAWARLGLRCGL